MDLKHFTAQGKRKTKLAKYPTDFTGDFKSKEDARDKLQSDIERLAKLQDLLYASDNYALLIIFQGMDAAGKDGAIKHVMSGINPQGVDVHSFKEPSSEELDHDYLWRSAKNMPERGRIGIFNRSYYEEVLITRVLPEILGKEKIPLSGKAKDLWENRFADINHYEKYLTRNGVHVLKFFLHISKGEQQKRLLARIDDPQKNWKFSGADLETRKRWKQYMAAYEEMLGGTNTSAAPWYIIPADHKWFARVAVADIIIKKLKSLDLHYPKVSKTQKANLQQYKKILLKN